MRYISPVRFVIVLQERKIVISATPGYIVVGSNLPYLIEKSLLLET